MQIPGTVITALSTLVIFLASYYLDADLVGAIVSFVVTVALALAKAYELQRADDVVIRAIDNRSKMTRWLLG